MDKEVNIGLIKYGLKYIKTGELLTYYISSNDGEDCNSESYHLSYCDNNPIWMVDNSEEAEYVRNYSTEWYNANFETPMHDYKAEELKVVKIISEIEEINVSIPSLEEILYSKNWDKEQIKRALNTREEKKQKRPYKKQFAPYTIYDLKEYMRKKNES